MVNAAVPPEDPPRHRRDYGVGEAGAGAAGRGRLLAASRARALAAAALRKPLNRG